MVFSWHGPRSPDFARRPLPDSRRPHLLRILRLIGEEEVCVCYFVEALRLSQPKISRHLARLRRSGIVHTSLSFTMSSISD